MFASTLLPATRSGNQVRFIGQENVVKHGFSLIKANSLISRLLGLRFISRKRTPEGIYLENKNAIHTYGMRFDVDLLFLDENHEPLVAVREIEPGHRGKVCDASHLIVLPSDWDTDKWDVRFNQETGK